MTNAVFSAGRPDYDWTTIFPPLLDGGTFNITNNTPQSQLVLTNGASRMVIDGSDLRADGARHLTGGTVTAITLMVGSDTIFRFDGFATARSASQLQAILDVYDAPVYSNSAFNLALDSLLRMELLNVTGSDRDDRVFGSIVGGDTVMSGNGDDEIVVGGGAVSSYDGGDGFDMLQFSTSGVDIDFDAGEVRDRSNDALFATIVNIEGAVGTVGSDVFHSSHQQEADHYFVASLGDDFYHGSNGENAYTQLSYHDLAWRFGNTGGVVVNLADGTVVKANGGGIDMVYGITAIRGTDAADSFTGNVWDNEFRGMGGTDSYSGSGGRDGVNFSSEGNQQGVTRGVFVNLSTASNTGNGTGFASVTLAARTGLDAYGNLESFTSIEDLTGTRFADRLVGDSKNNQLRGLDGSDRLFGGAGRDELDGNEGNDYLDGGTGDDDVWGGRGNDTMIGGTGNDSIDGGEGNDAITAGAGFDFINGSSGTDTMDGEAGFDMYAFDSFNRSEDSNGDGNSNEHGGDRITVTLTGGVGAGTMTGFFGIDSTQLTPTAAAVSTSFSNLERVRGTVGNDTFTVGTAFANTEDASTSFSDLVRGSLGAFEFVGGDGVDTFNDTARTGLAMVNYQEEAWSHPDFNSDGGRRWGDLGEAGVAVNTSGTTRSLGAFGNVASNRAIDTWGKIDVLNGVAAFRLTDTVDYFYGGSDDVYVDGRNGEDVLTGGIGNDEIRGGEGNDTLRGGAGHDRLAGHNGNDAIRGDAGNDDISGDDGDDTLGGDAGNDFLSGGRGNDTLRGNDGRDELQGDDGADNLDGGAGNDQVWAGSDDDVARGGAGDDEVEGEDGNDMVYGDAGNDRLRGGDDDDVIVGGADDDEIEGDDGNDTIYGDDEASVSSLGGQDRIWGGGGNDLVFGGIGDDQIEGQDGADTLNGGAGDDRIEGGDDNDIINGDAGEDRLQGDDGNDTIDGGTDDDAIDGGWGNDILRGGTGNDYLEGREGNDVLEGNSGSDILDGGNGDDTFVLGSEASGVDAIYDISGVDTITSSITRTLSTFFAIENLTLVGTSSVNATGNFADNVITGNSGLNTLSGDSGSDTLLGGGGNDMLLGGDGNDTLSGGGGKDTVTGGLGNDIFDFDDVLDFGNTSTTRDILTEFNKVPGNQDLIDLRDVDADSETAGYQSFTFVAAKGAAFTGANGSLAWTQIDETGTANDRTIIRADLDGDKVTDIQIQINGLVDMTLGDFLL